MSSHSDLKKTAKKEVASYHASDRGIIQLSGEDSLNFLHNQSTNEIKSLKAGQGCHTVFVNSTARNLDLATVYIAEDKVLLLVSPNRTQFIMEWLDRYLFPMDQVKLKNISQENTVFYFYGEKSSELLQKWELNPLSDQPFASHEMTEINGISARVAVGTDLGLTGYTFIVSSEEANAFQEVLSNAGVTSLSPEVWEELSLEQGRPLPDYELTENYNPLEAGLWEAISFDKGCYIGQETIARLNTYQGVKQRLWGLELSQSVAPETPITVEGKKVGKLTRILETEEGVKGLGYVRTKAGGEGLTVQVGDATAKVVAVPFITHPSNSS